MRRTKKRQEKLCALELFVKGMKGRGRDGVSRIESQVSGKDKAMNWLVKLGCVCERYEMEMKLKERLRKGLSEFGEIDESESPDKKTLRKQISRNGVQSSIDLLSKPLK